MEGLQPVRTAARHRCVREKAGRRRHLAPMPNQPQRNPLDTTRFETVEEGQDPQRLSRFSYPLNNPAADLADSLHRSETAGKLNRNRNPAADMQSIGTCTAHR